MYKEDLALNNLQWLICHKTQLNLLSKHFIIRWCVYSTNIRLVISQKLNKIAENQLLVTSKLRGEQDKYKSCIP